MNAKAETSASAFDTVKLMFSVAVLIGGIVGFYYFEEQATVIRVIGLLAAAAVAVVVALTTERGQALWRFIQGSRAEVRKVVWPTRQETIQTTLTVFVFVLILSLFFWALDFFLLWATRLLTGQGG